jgi:hypothetical protein
MGDPLPGLFHVRCQCGHDLAQGEAFVVGQTGHWRAHRVGSDHSSLDEGGFHDGHVGGNPVGRPEFFTTAYFHKPAGLSEEIGQAGFTGIDVYGVEGPGWPLRREWADPRRREQILFAARAVETEPSLLGFSDHLIAAATKP